MTCARSRRSSRAPAGPPSRSPRTSAVTRPKLAYWRAQLATLTAASPLSSGNARDEAADPGVMFIAANAAFRGTPGSSRRRSDDQPSIASTACCRRMPRCCEPTRQCRCLVQLRIRVSLPGHGGQEQES